MSLQHKTLAEAKAIIEHVYASENRVGFTGLKDIDDVPFINEQQVVDVITDHPEQCKLAGPSSN